MKALELFYHIVESSFFLDDSASVKKETRGEEKLDPYLQECQDELVKIFRKAILALDETHLEHIKVLGLFYCLQRCTKRGLVQYLSDVSLRPGSDLCLDFIQAVEVYFTMQYRISCHMRDPKSIPTMRTQLFNSYKRVMEIYFLVRSAVSLGLLQLHQTSWLLARESLYTEFYLMRQHALGLPQTAEDSAAAAASTLAALSSNGCTENIDQASVEPQEKKRGVTAAGLDDAGGGTGNNESDSDGDESDHDNDGDGHDNGADGEIVDNE